MALTETFGANLRHQRKSKNIIQAELAERVGVSTEMISKVERGIASPSFSTLGKLADVLGVPEVIFFELGLVAVPNGERGHTLQKIHTNLLPMSPG